MDRGDSDGKFPEVLIDLKEAQLPIKKVPSLKKTLTVQGAESFLQALK